MLKEVNILIINRVDIQLDVSSFRSLVYSFIHSYFLFFYLLIFMILCFMVAEYLGTKNESRKLIY